MLASLEPARCWPGACSFYGMALLALRWSCTGLVVTVAVRRVPVLRHAQRTGTQAYFASKVFVVSAEGRWRWRLGRWAWCGQWFIDLGVVQFLDKVGLWSRPLPKTVWKFLVVQKTIEISQLQFIDKVCRLSWRGGKSPVRGSFWTRLSSCPLRADSFGVQTLRKLWCSAVAVLGKVDMPVVATTGACGCSSRTWLTCPLLRRQVQFLNKVAMPLVATTGAFGFYRAENCGGSAVAVLGRCLLAVHRRLWTTLWSRRDVVLRAVLGQGRWHARCVQRQGVDVPVIKQRQVGFCQQWKCLRFSSSGRLRTFQLCNRFAYGGYGGDEIWRFGCAWEGLFRRY